MPINSRPPKSDWARICNLIFAINLLLGVGLYCLVSEYEEVTWAAIKWPDFFNQMADFADKYKPWQLRKYVMLSDIMLVLTAWQCLVASFYVFIREPQLSFAGYLKDLNSLRARKGGIHSLKPRNHVLFNIFFPLAAAYAFPLTLLNFLPEEAMGDCRRCGLVWALLCYGVAASAAVILMLISYINILLLARTGGNVASILVTRPVPPQPACAGRGSPVATAQEARETDFPAYDVILWLRKLAPVLSGLLFWFVLTHAPASDPADYGDIHGEILSAIEKGKLDADLAGEFHDIIWAYDATVIFTALASLAYLTVLFRNFSRWPFYRATQKMWPRVKSMRTLFQRVWSYIYVVVGNIGLLMFFLVAPYLAATDGSLDGNAFTLATVAMMPPFAVLTWIRQAAYILHRSRYDHKALIAQTRTGTRNDQQTI